MARPSSQPEYRERHIILFDLNFDWDFDEVDTIAEMYQGGATLEEMATRRISQFTGLDNAMDETALLLMDLSRRKKIQTRKGGVL